LYWSQLGIGIFNQLLMMTFCPSSGLHNSESSKGQIDQHKFVVSRNGVFDFIVGRNSVTTIPSQAFCNIFCWESSCRPQEKLLQLCCAALP